MEQSSPPVLEEPILEGWILEEPILEEPSAGVGERTYGILDSVRGAVDVCSVAAGDRGVDEWMAVLGEVSQALTVLAAARDAAIVRLAAIDETVTEDGVVGEQVNGLGTVCLDAGAMVSTATGTSARFGEELVEQAITRVVRAPALHEAMLEGVLDDYKARRLAGELSDVPPDLARAVVDALAGDLASKSGPALQRKARTILMSLCPDLLRERIRKARKGVGLRRWMGEPGTDSWGGAFPSERAATAWAAIDALARRYRLEGTYDTLEQARAYALMDLVAGNVTVETVLHLTVPAEALEEATRASQDAGGVRAPDAESEQGRPADAHHGSWDGSWDGSRDGLGDGSGDSTNDCTGRGGASVVSPHGRGSVRDRDWGHVGAPSGPASFVRASFVRPQAVHTSGEDAASDATFVGVAGVQGRSISWFPLTALTSRSLDAGPAAEVCHPWTGALLDPGDMLATRAYRPGRALKALVRQRDGGCRFPGCSISARQCDLDHVVAWPHGPTAASNLICLCRRHHRIKQRHRWRVRLVADGAVEWTDPTGRRHLTEPVDHLGATQVRVIDAGPGDIEPLDSDPHDVEPGDVEPLNSDPHDVEPGDVEPGDVEPHHIAVAGERSMESEDLSTSPLECWLAVSVEHATGGIPAASRPSSTGGRGGRCPAVVTGEELDEMSRAVRAGLFATIDDALGSRSSPAVGPPRSTRVCRVDHHIAPRERIVKVRLRHRHLDDPASAMESPPESPPF